MRINGKIIYLFFILLTFCKEKTNSKLPSITIDSDKSVYYVGEYYKAKVSLSDTSLFIYKEPDGVFYKVIPWIIVDEDTLDNFEDNYGYISFLIDSSKMGQRSYHVSIMVPSPEGGDITFSKLVYYTVASSRE
jgi:hypothetical protein